MTENVLRVIIKNTLEIGLEYGAKQKLKIPLQSEESRPDELNKDTGPNQCNLLEA